MREHRVTDMNSSLCVHFMHSVQRENKKYPRESSKKVRTPNFIITGPWENVFLHEYGRTDGRCKRLALRGYRITDIACRQLGLLLHMAVGGAHVLRRIFVASAARYCTAVVRREPVTDLGSRTHCSVGWQRDESADHDDVNDPFIYM